MPTTLLKHPSGAEYEITTPGSHPPLQDHQVAKIVSDHTGHPPVSGAGLSHPAAVAAGHPSTLPSAPVHELEAASHARSMGDSPESVPVFNEPIPHGPTLGASHVSMPPHMPSTLMGHEGVPPIGHSMGHGGSSPGSGRGAGATPGHASAPLAPSNVNLGNLHPHTRAERQTAFNAVKSAAAKSGDPHPEIAAAQWALESGWGKSPTANNFFGIKYFGSDPKLGVKTATHEGDGHGHLTATTGNFRAYTSPEDGLLHHTHLVTGPLYPGYSRAKTSRDAVEALQHGKNGAYARSRNGPEQYVGQIMQIVDMYGSSANSGSSPTGPVGGPSLESKPRSPASPLGGTSTGSALANGIGYHSYPVDYGFVRQPVPGHEDKVFDPTGKTQYALGDYLRYRGQMNDYTSKMHAHNSNPLSKIGLAGPPPGHPKLPRPISPSSTPLLPANSPGSLANLAAKRKPVTTAVAGQFDPDKLYSPNGVRPGMHPLASAALDAAIASTGLHTHVSQAIGYAKPSHGYHKPEGHYRLVGGQAVQVPGTQLYSWDSGTPGNVVHHRYGAATDISVNGLSDPQIHKLANALGEHGFAAWYRDWKGNRHIHAVYAGVPMKEPLESQVEDYLQGRSGAVGHGRDRSITPQEQAAVKKEYGSWYGFRQTHQLKKR